MVGVQSLSITLSVSLVICTGFIVGYMSISSGKEVIDDARTTGKDGVDSCLASGDRDVRMVAGRYLKEVTGSVENRVANLFDIGKGILEAGVSIAKSVHPDDMTASGPNKDAFLDTTIRKFLSGSLRANYGKGVTQTLWRWGDAELIFFVMHPSLALPNKDGSIPWGVVETHTAPMNFTPGVHANRRLTENLAYLSAGLANDDHTLQDPYLPCWRARYPTQPTPPQLGEQAFGYCPMPRAFFYGTAAALSGSKALMFNNAATTDQPLMPPETIQAAPVFPYFGWMPISLSMSYTDPRQTNYLGPRQGNRVGYFTVSLSGESVSEIFESTPMPDGAILYCTDKNPWTGVVGQLLATTHGNLTDWMEVSLPGTTTRYPWRVPIAVVNHTYTDNVTGVTSLSVVGQHSRFVFGGMKGYEAAAVATKEQFMEWEDATGTVYWFMVLHMKFANMNWYISLLVPRSSIMDNIDASVVKIRKAQDESISDGNDKEEKSMIVTVVVAVCVAAALIVLSVLMTKAILSPIIELGDDMASVAMMRVEDVDMEGGLSSLAEVNSMQRSFQTMVRNLIEYKQYMPQALLVDEDDDDEESLSDRKKEGAMPKGGPSKSKRTVGSKGSQATQKTQMTHIAAAAQGSKLTDTSLKRKQVSVVCYNVVGWASAAQNLGDAALQDMATQLYKALQSVVTPKKGVFDMFSGDRFIVAHNAFTAQAVHKVTSVTAAIEARAKVAGLITGAGKPLSLSYAVCSGEAKVGQMGCQGMKKVTIYSRALPLAVALEKLNKERGWKGVVNHLLAKDVMSELTLKAVDAVSFDTGKAGKYGAATQGVYEVHGVVAAGDEEWMYQMEEAETSGLYSLWNKGAQAVWVGDFDEAAAVLMKLSDEQKAEADREPLGAAVKGRSFTPSTL